MTEGQSSSLELSDKNFVEDYLTFAVWQPAYMAHWLLLQAESASAAKACFALQMYLNMEIALETLSKWYFTLRDWRRASESLLWRFKTTEVRENPDAEDYATHVALKDVEASSVDDLLLRLKQPSSDDLKARGWSEDELTEREKTIPDLVATLTAGLQNRMAGSGDLRRAYNNLKHGLLVLQDLPGFTKPPGSIFLIAGLRNDEPDSSMITPLGLASDSQSLRLLRDNCVGVSRLIAALLAVLPWYYQTNATWNDYQKQPNNAIGAMQMAWKKLDKLVQTS